MRFRGWAVQAGTFFLHDAGLGKGRSALLVSLACQCRQAWVGGGLSALPGVPGGG